MKWNMRYDARKIFLLSAATTVFSVGLAVSQASFADCAPTYKTVCVEKTDKGRCVKYEKIETTSCCYECFSWDKQGNCLKTKKVPC